MSSKLEPAIWSRDTGHIVIHGRVDVCTVIQSYGGQNQIFSHRFVTIFSYSWCSVSNDSNGNNSNSNNNSDIDNNDANDGSKTFEGRGA